MKSMIPVKIVLALILITASVFAWQGIDMHMQVNVEETKFHELQADYFSQAKAVRDAAETGSQLNADLVNIMNYPSELLRLKLVGVGKILTGIFLVLFAIMMTLMMMPVKLGAVINSQKK